MKEIALFFMKKNGKITGNNTFNKVFCNRILLYYRSSPIFRKLLDFHKLWLIFSTYFPNWKH